MRQSIEKAIKKVGFDFSSFTDEDIINLFRELHDKRVIDFAVEGRESIGIYGDIWLQVEWYFREIDYFVILDYGFDTDFESIDDILDTIEFYNQEIEELKTKIKQ